MKIKWPWSKNTSENISIDEYKCRTYNYETADVFSIHHFKELQLNENDISLKFAYSYQTVQSFLFKIKITNEQLKLMDNNEYNKILSLIEDKLNISIEDINDNRLIYR